MNSLFLESMLLADGTGNTSNAIFNETSRGFIGFLFLGILIFFAIYVYFSIAYSKIGEKNNLTNSGVAWMPFYGPIAIIFESSKMHWWPFLTLTVGILGGYLSIFLGMLESIWMLVVGTGMMFLTLITFGVMGIIWHWKTYKNIGKPGWWSLVPIISLILGYILVFAGMVLGLGSVMIIGAIILLLGFIAHSVFIGLAAWTTKEEMS
jgi:hypothetical protein